MADHAKPNPARSARPARLAVLDRDGKLVAQSIDMRTQRQFLNMLARAGLHNQVTRLQARHPRAR